MSIVQNLLKKVLSVPNVIEYIRDAIESKKFTKRTELANHLCERFGFYDPCGALQLGSCLKALNLLEAKGNFVLPPSKRRKKSLAPRRLSEPVPFPHDVPESVEDIKDLELVQVNTEEQKRTWNELMLSEHPRGAGPLVGRQMRYLISSSHGWLGGVGFAAAALHMEERDAWIGWDNTCRQKYLHYIINMSRLLIRPKMQCKNLASKVLSISLKKLPKDFEMRYGYKPLLVESFVDDSLHLGTCYKAANWIEIGKTKGRGRQDHLNIAPLSIKSIYVYPFVEDFRTRLGLSSSSGQGKLNFTDGLESEVWAQNEFGGAPLGDERLSKRLVKIAESQAKVPDRAFCGVEQGDWAATKAYYRFVDQPDDSAISMSGILIPHRKRTIRRMMDQKMVLTIQDGSDLNFNNLNNCEGLGQIGTNQTGAKSHGLHLHSTMAITTNGVPLGVLNAECSSPEPKSDQKQGSTYTIPIEEKKIYVWMKHYRDLVKISQKMPETRLVNICDREADFFELFDEQRKNPAVDLLIRARQDRNITEEPYKLFQAAREAPIQSTVQLKITRQSKRKKKNKQRARPERMDRISNLTIRARKVKLKPSSRSLKDAIPLEVSVIHALEENPPEGEEPIEWFLLTTLPIDSATNAEKYLQWYCLRWRIEDWHRVLKSGCRIESLAHKSAERLKRAISINLVIAWRILLMTLLGREIPELPAEILFSDIELRTLEAYAKKKGLSPPRKLNEAVILVAKIGGYLGRKNDPPPGCQLLWHGYTEFQFMCLGYSLLDPEL